jgi:predicted small secreted protein
MKKIVNGLLLIAFLSGLVACNTVEGMGRDIERAGEKLQRSAK